MCIEAVGDSYDETGLTGSFSPFSIWNGRQIQPFFSSVTHLAELTNSFFEKVIQPTERKVFGNYIIGGGRPIGVCPRGHIAYHIYQQPPADSILLCDFKGDRHEEHCPFELYKFMRIIGRD